MTSAGRTNISIQVSATLMHTKSGNDLRLIALCARSRVFLFEKEKPRDPWVASVLLQAISMQPPEPALHACITPNFINTRIYNTTAAMIDRTGRSQTFGHMRSIPTTAACPVVYVPGGLGSDCWHEHHSTRSRRPVSASRRGRQTWGCLGEINDAAESIVGECCQGGDRLEYTNSAGVYKQQEQRLLLLARVISSVSFLRCEFVQLCKCNRLRSDLCYVVVGFDNNRPSS